MQSRKTSYWREFIPKVWICFREGYTLLLFRRDLMAGITVGIVSLPLVMAFAMASGVSPERGLYTAVVAGFLIGLLGGSRSQIAGPTGAFVVVVYGVVERHGYEGLVGATLMAAGMLILAALTRLGKLIRYIPYPLVIGFTTGIALVLLSSQVKDFFGLEMANVPAEFLSKWQALLYALPTLSWGALGVGGITLLLITCIRRFFPVLPWGVIGIVMATAVCSLCSVPVETIHSRYGEISCALPAPAWPQLGFSFEQWCSLIPDAMTIAFLAGIEALLSALVADAAAGTRHKSNCELLAHGIGNVGSVLFGGIPATGAIARTATNVRIGAKTPVAAMINALVVFVLVWVFAPFVGKIPLPALAAVLIMVAWNMSELVHFRGLFKAPIEDRVIMLIAFSFTVLFDLTVAVGVAMTATAFLFLRKMGKASKVVLVSRESAPSQGEIKVYEIQGPFFFAVADALRDLEVGTAVCILNLGKVSSIDASGMRALAEFSSRCAAQKNILLLSEIRQEMKQSMEKFGFSFGGVQTFASTAAALESARELAKLSHDSSCRDPRLPVAPSQA